MSDTPGASSEPSTTQEIRRRSIAGVRWTVAQTIVVALLGPVAQIVKARFLSPGELGAVAVFMIVYGLMNTMENAGLSQSIVQKQELDGGDRFTFLLLALGLGVAGSTGLFLLSTTIEAIVGVPGSGELIGTGSLLLLFAMADQYLRALLHRALLFRGTSIVESAKRALNVIFSFLFFVLGFGPQSIVLGLLACSIVATGSLILLALHHRVVRLELRWKGEAIRHLGGFGLPVAGKQFFTYFTHQADEMVVAVALTPETLGYYHLAKETLQKLQSVITGAFSRILLSLFSRLRGDRARMSRVYGRIALFVSYVGISLFVGLALTAHDVVPAVFGSRWAGSVQAFQVLSIALIPIALTANLASSFLYSLGKSRGVLLADIATNLPYVVCLYLLRNSGVQAILFAYLVYCFAKGISLQGMANRN
ncbi:MAG: oligosaccharide flippase family protein, partial [Thermomicrobiales bacterium]|nr:oligosaccharide flippase family protein [Thermomicrobiales bacterium]